ncbi:restriction endonuclease subunit S [Ferrimonas gelatinilytica]|uniref:Type I restriction modification DNA specificity domain-containing protein n=1 Tax=Ferrimonas gelatinilytica TaxID=1255257 RepID=A0ABP9RW32_9GAMM
MVPNGWSKKKLGQILPQPYKNGIYKSADLYGSGTEILRINDFNNEGEVTSGQLSLVQLSESEVRGYVLNKGDVVVNRVNSLTHLGKSVLWSDDSSPVYESNMMRIQVEGADITPEFLARVLQSKPSRTFFQRVAKRAVAQASISQQDVKSLPILLPPVAEQRKIAKILASWDKAIATTECLIANSQQQKKALMQQLLTGKKRFAGFEGEWSYKTINEIATRIQRKSDGEDHPVLTISSLSGFVTQADKYSRYMAGESVKNYTLLKQGEFAYNKGNSKTYQFGCIFDLEGFETGLVPHVYVCFKLNEGLSHRYFKYLFEADYLKPQLGALVNTGVRNNGLLNIKPAEFMNTKVPVPCFDEQERIADVLHAASEELKALNSKLEHLKQEKQALMQQLLTGKRRVVVDDPEAT